MTDSGDQRLEEAIRRALDQVVKITRPDGGSGTGVYLPGHKIVTCLHVVEGSPGIYVAFRSGERIEADVLAASREFDLALLGLRRTPTSLNADQLGGISLHSDSVEPGEELAAIGHPFGLDWSVTGGHYNAIRQPGEDPLPRFGIALEAPLVQVDVVINQGNSGGPIIDRAGHLIGLADSILNPALANNIGFAIDGQTVLGFWQNNQNNTQALAAYSCDHHHPPGLTFCPSTGKPIKTLDPIPMPGPEGVRYSCGHVHPPGLEFCPLTGKPAEPIDELPEDLAEAPDEGQQEQVTCTNCGTIYSAALDACPQCGKPNPS